MKWSDSNKSSMGGNQQKRRSSWTRHTSYMTLQNEEKIHVPAEVSANTRATIRCAEKRLDNNTKHLDNIKRKSLSQLDGQRKLLEKSMMAYSEKMKHITKSRNNEHNNEIFRELRTRNSERDDRVIKSPTASIRSHFSLPAKIINKHHNESRSLKGFHQVNIYSPIAERSAESSPMLRPLSAPRRYNFSSSESDRSHNKQSRGTGSSVKSYSPKDKVVCTINDEPVNFKQEIPNGKVAPRVAVCSLPWLKADHLSDSAYSSASEDFDRENSDLCSEHSERTGVSISTTSDSSKQNILTVPVVHVRRNTRKFKKRGKASSNSPRKHICVVDTESRICSHA